MSEPPLSRTAHHGRESSAQNIHTAAPDSLAGALTFTAQRFVAIATELDEARAKLAAVETLCDQPAEWHVYEAYDVGEVFPVDTVRDWIDDVRAALREAKL